MEENSDAPSHQRLAEIRENLIMSISVYCETEERFCVSILLAEAYNTNQDSMEYDYRVCSALQCRQTTYIIHYDSSHEFDGPARWSCPVLLWSSTQPQIGIIRAGPCLNSDTTGIFDV